MELDIFVKNASYSSTLQFCYVHITSCSLFAFKSHPAILYAKNVVIVSLGKEKEGAGLVLSQFHLAPGCLNKSPPGL